MSDSENKRRRTDSVPIPETPEELYTSFIIKSDEVREASHRLANRLHEATLSLHVVEDLAKKNRLKRWLVTLSTFVFTLWVALWAMDQHVEQCAVIGKPSPESTTKVLFWEVPTLRVCDITFPLHDHQRTQRIQQDPYLRRDVEQVIGRWIDKNALEIQRRFRKGLREGLRRRDNARYD